MRIDVKNNPIVNRTTNNIKYCKDINNFNVLTPEEEFNLFIEYKKTGNTKIKDKICLHNLKFVISVAKKYYNAIQHYKCMELDDLIMEGNIGLIQSIDRFDPTRGFKFISFAVWYIRQSIILSIENKLRFIRIPISQMTKLNAINKLEQELEQEFSYHICQSQLEEKANTSIDNYVNYWSTINVPINSHGVNSNSYEYGTIELQSTEFSPDLNILTKSFQTELDKIFDVCKISNNAKELITDFYGLNGQSALKLVEISKKYNLSSQTIRNRINKALLKLRIYNRKNKNVLLNEFLSN